MSDNKNIKTAIKNSKELQEKLIDNSINKMIIDDDTGEKNIEKIKKDEKKSSPKVKKIKRENKSISKKITENKIEFELIEKFNYKFFNFNGVILENPINGAVCNFIRFIFKDEEIKNSKKETPINNFQNENNENSIVTTVLNDMNSYTEKRQNKNAGKKLAEEVSKNKIMLKKKRGKKENECDDKIIPQEDNPRNYTYEIDKKNTNYKGIIIRKISEVKLKNNADLKLNEKSKIKLKSALSENNLTKGKKIIPCGQKSKKKNISSGSEIVPIINEVKNITNEDKKIKLNNIIQNANSSVFDHLVIGDKINKKKEEINTIAQIHDVVGLEAVTVTDFAFENKTCNFFFLILAILDFKFDQINNLSIEIFQNDIQTLDDTNLLNDTIITFYLKFVENYMMYYYYQGKGKKIYSFNTYFFVYIQNEYDESISKCLDSFKKLNKWGKYIDIFKCKYIAIPIFESGHWSLVIICNPSLLKNVIENMRCRAEESVKSPVILYFDSVYPENNKCISVIKRYLIIEYLRREGDNNVKDFVEENIDEIEIAIKSCSPKVPMQNNTFDCGIYVLVYAELFFLNPKFVLSRIDKEVIFFLISK